MVVIVEKGIRGEIFHGKADNKYMKEYHKNKNDHIQNIGMKTIFMIGQCRKNSSE